MRTNQPLWDRITAKLKRDNNNQWNARLAQRAVILYKQAGGKYTTPKPKTNSLIKWTKEDWQYVGKPKNSRYLPKKVIDKMPSRLKTEENKLKGDKLGQKVSYTSELTKTMKKLKVL